MTLSTTGLADILGAYEVLIHWGALEYREDLRTLRHKAFDDLISGLNHLEPRVLDSKSRVALHAARAQAEKALTMYRMGGDIGGSVEALKQSREALLRVGLKAEIDRTKGGPPG